MAFARSRGLVGCFGLHALLLYGMCIVVLLSGVVRGMSVAGVVDVSPKYASFVLVRVVDVASGAVVRIAPLDATHTFSFANVMDNVRLQAVLQPSERQYRVDTSSSVLELDVTNTTVTDVRLRVVVINDDGIDAHTGVTASAAPESSLFVALVVLCVFALSWSLRHRITSLSDALTLKAPRPRRVVMVR